MGTVSRVRNIVVGVLAHRAGAVRTRTEAVAIATRHPEGITGYPPTNDAFDEALRRRADVLAQRLEEL